MSYLESKQALESQYFNWKCVICSQVAISPFTFEEQHLIEYGPYTDISGHKWIKCDNCLHLYHIHCLKEDIPTGKYMCMRDENDGGPGGGSGHGWGCGRGCHVIPGDRLPPKPRKMGSATKNQP